MRDVHPHLRVVVTESIVRQPCLTVIILSLEQERYHSLVARLLNDVPVHVEHPAPHLVAIGIVCLRRCSELVGQYRVGPAFLYHCHRYERLLVEEPYRHVTAFRVRVPPVLHDGVFPALLPLVQRHVAVPHPPRHSRAEALGEPAPERVVCELHLPLVGPHHLCQGAVGVPPVSPAVLLAVKPLSRAEVAFRQVAVTVVLAVPFTVLLQPSATEVAAQLHVRVGIQVPHRVALSPLLPAVGVFRPVELPRRGVGVAGLAMSYHLIPHLLNHFPHLSMNW